MLKHETDCTSHSAAAGAAQVTSGDEPLPPPPPPPPPGPDGGCEDTTITVTAKTSLADIAKEVRHAMQPSCV